MDTKPIRLLLVEDNAADARLLRELLKEITTAQFDITVTVRLSEALTKIHGGSFDVVLTDLSLPDSHGLDAFRELHSAAPMVPVIVLSGVDDETLAVSAVREGAQDYLVKDRVDPHLLFRSIRYAIERHAAERKLIDSEAFYHSLVEHLPQNICRKDLQGRFTFANKRCCAMLGRPLADIIGKTDFELFPRDLAEKYWKDDLKVIETGQVFETVEENFTPQGEKVYVDVVKTPIYDPRGRVIGIQAIFWDIVNERKRAEECLRNSEAQYHSLVENLPQYIFRKDLSERFTFANQRFCQMLGKPLEEIIGKTDFDFYPAALAAKYQRDDRLVIQTGNICETIEENVAPNGEKLYVNVVKTPVLDGEGHIIGTQCIFWDITERKRAQEQLQKAHEELARSEVTLRKANEDLKAAQLQLIQAEKMESIGTLATGVAHEVKNPLAILQMGINYLAKKSPSGDENIAMVLQEMKEAITRADAIMRGLLDFAASKQLAVKTEDLNQIILETLKMVRHELNKNHVELVKDLGGPLPKVAVDKTQIQQVFVNLFVNAIHAMPDGGRLSVRTYAKQMTETTHTEGSRKSDHLWVGDTAVVAEVEDTGTGIPTDLLSKIFDPFFTTKPTGVGTGLGLPVSRKIIELHGGTIEIKNMPEDGGVRVTVLLKEHRNP